MVQILVGTRIREERRKQGRKQTDLAKDVNISPAYLNLIEHNKRQIAGELLSALSKSLGISRDFLSETLSTQTIERIQQAIRTLGISNVELDRLDEFITMFPGFAKLLDRQIAESQTQLDQVAILSDQLEHDVVLRETLHIMLSNITAIRSSAEILLTHGNIPVETRSKFNQNIFTETKRLARNTSHLLDRLDTDVAPQSPNASHPDGHPAHYQQPHPMADATPATDDQDCFGRHIPALETGTTTIDAVITSYFTSASALPPSRYARITAWAKTYQQVAAMLPLEQVWDSRHDHQFSPFALADVTGAPVDATMFRLAHLPTDTGDWPSFGYLEVDNSAGVLSRHELPALRLPHRSGACPRWPIYRAFSCPGQAISVQLDQLGSPLVIAHSIAKGQKEHSVGLPSVARAAMLYEIAPASSNSRPTYPTLEVGFHCSVCARLDCVDRRVQYSLNQ